MVYMRGLVCISGEQDSKNKLIKSVEYLAPSSKIWANLPSVKRARFEAAACTFQNRYIFVFGGIYDESIEYFDY